MYFLGCLSCVRDSPIQSRPGFVFHKPVFPLLVIGVLEQTGQLRLLSCWGRYSLPRSCRCWFCSGCRFSRDGAGNFSLGAAAFVSPIVLGYWKESYNVYFGTAILLNALALFILRYKESPDESRSRGGRLSHRAEYAGAPGPVFSLHGLDP